MPYGTGFIVATRYDNHAFQAIVTCKHVIEDIPGELVHIRINQQQGGAIVIGSPKAEWLPHPDKNVDLMVCPAVLPLDQFSILHLDLIGPISLTESVLQTEQIGVGDDVAIVGMFVQRLGERTNIPIVRSGTIAAMPREPIETKYGMHDAYLVETRSIDGLSGSPAFVQLPQQRVVDKMPQYRSKRPLYLMGMMLGHHEVINPRDAITIKQKGPRPPVENEVIARVLSNTGIGIVLPLHYIDQAVNQPTLQEGRKAALTNKKAERRYVSDSAHPPSVSELPPESALPTTEVEGDDKHRERFTVLQDAVLGKPKRDD